MVKLVSKFLFSLLLIGFGGNAFTQNIDTTATKAVSPVINSPTYIADEVVAVVGSSMILLSELKMAEEYIQKGYIQRGYTGADPRSEALEALLLQKLLATQAALDSLPVNNNSVEAETDGRLDMLIKEKGTVKEVERFFNKPIFSVRDYIRRKVMESDMARSMQQKVEGEVKMSPADVSRYIKTIDKDSLPIIPEQYVYAQIVKYPIMDDNARMNVKEQLLDIRDRITKGTSFAALARMYSEDPGSAMRGGEMDPQPRESFVGAFSDALAALKPGQISEIVETEFGFHIIQLIDKNDNLYHCRHILLRVKFDGEQRAAAVSLLDSIAHKIRVDSLAFEDAVERYSDDKDSRQSKGVVINSVYERYGARMKSKRFFKDELGPDYERLRTLSPGQHTDAFESMDTKLVEVIKVIKLVEVIPSHIATLKEDYAQLEDITLGQKKSEVFAQWLDKKIDLMYIKIEDGYRDIPLKNNKWKK